MSRRLTLVLVLVSLAVLYGFRVAASLVDIRRFRESPTREGAEAVFANERPHILAARAVAFKRGGALYHTAIRDWIYWAHGAPPRIRVADNPWNRRFLAGDVRRMDDEARSLYLAGYPVRPTGEIVDLLIGEVERGELVALGPLSRMKQVSPALDAWWRASIAEGSFEEVLDHYYDHLGWAGPVPSPGHAAGLLARVSEGLRDGSLQPDRRVVRAAGRLIPYADASGAWIEALEGELLPERLPRWSDYFDGVTCPGDEDAEEAVRGGRRALRVRARILERADARLDAADVPTAVRLASLHHVLHCEPDRAARLVQPLAEASDSEWRKGAIVLLNRHGQPGVAAMIDGAFEGAAPRSVMFRYTGEYMHSEAGRAYTELAGHDYLETGKQYPPSGYDPERESPERWQAFIDRYPWFPGTDDAYYRLAYAAAVQGDVATAMEALEDYWTADLPDVDASPYLAYLLQAIEGTWPGTASAYPVSDALHYVLTHPVSDLVMVRGPAAGGGTAAAAALAERVEGLLDAATSGPLADERGGLEAILAVLAATDGVGAAERPAAVYALGPLPLSRALYGGLFGTEEAYLDVPLQGELPHQRALFGVWARLGSPDPAAAQAALGWVMVHRRSWPGLVGSLAGLYARAYEAGRTGGVPPEWRETFCTLEYLARTRAPDLCRSAP